MEIIFLGGVHGVGKTTLSRRLSSKNDIFYCTAGDLIRSSGADMDARKKQVANPNGNQDKLIAAFERVRDKEIPKSIILDGHFAIYDAKGFIVEIDVDVFIALKITRIICMFDEPNIIARRLFERDGVLPNIGSISALQEAEVKNSKKVATILNLPIISVNARIIGKEVRFDDNYALTL